MHLFSGLLEMLSAFAPTTFALLGTNPANLKNHPDTVDDFFRLNARFLQRRTNLPYLNHPVFTSVMEYALHASCLDHRHSGSSLNLAGFFRDPVPR